MHRETANGITTALAVCAFDTEPDDLSVERIRILFRVTDSGCTGFGIVLAGIVRYYVITRLSLSSYQIRCLLGQIKSRMPSSAGEKKITQGQIQYIRRDKWLDL